MSSDLTNNSQHTETELVAQIKEAKIKTEVMILLGMCYVTETYAASFHKQIGSISPAAVRDRIRIETLTTLYPNVYILSISNDDHVGEGNVETGHHLFGSFGARIVPRIVECLAKLPNPATIKYILADYCRMPTVYAELCFHALPEMLKSMWERQLLMLDTVIILPNIYNCAWSTKFDTSIFCVNLNSETESIECPLKTVTNATV